MNDDLAEDWPDPPDWDRPGRERIRRIDDAYIYKCDRCGAVVVEWQKHSDWHAGLAKSAALVLAALGAAGRVRRDQIPPDVLLTVEWVEKVTGKKLVA